MYATNENESEEEWVYLDETPPTSQIVRRKVNSIGGRRSTSSSSSDSISSSSRSGQSDSLSSISSIEPQIIAFRFEPLQYNDERLSPLTYRSNRLHSTTDMEFLEAMENEVPLLLNYDDVPQTPKTSNPLFFARRDVSYENDNSMFQPCVNSQDELNEYHVLNTGFELNNTISSIDSSESSLLCFNMDEKDKTEVNRLNSISEKVKPSVLIEQNKSVYICIILLVTIPFVLGHAITRRDQSMITKLVDELVKTNQRLHIINDIPIGNIEDTLTKQFDSKLRYIVQQQSAWHDHEKNVFSLQMRELRSILLMTQENLTDTIDKLTKENERLQEQIKSLEHRLEVTEEQYPKFGRACIDGVNCTRSTSDESVDSNAFEQTSSIDSDSSVNSASTFGYLSTAISKLVTRRYAYIEKSKQKLAYFIDSSPAQLLRTSFHRTVTMISVSLSKVTSSYAAWGKSHDRHPTKNDVKRKRPMLRRQPLRLTVRNNSNRQHTIDEQHDCYTKFFFPISKICTLRHWLSKFVRY